MKRTVSRLIAAFVLILLSALCYLPLAANGQNITLVGQLNPFLTANDNYGDVWGEGDYAYIGGAAGIAIIDISDPSSPFLAAVYDPPAEFFGDSFFDVKVHGGIGYFPSSQGTGLHIVDLSDPTMPSLISRITSAQNGYDDIHNVFYSNGYLYEADSASPVIKVFDVSDPNRPFFVRDIMTSGVSEQVHDVTVINDRLYASGLNDTYIYDIRSIESVAPSLLATIATGSATHSSWVTSDGRLMLSAQEGGARDVRIYDLSDLQDPLLLSSIKAPSLGFSASSPHNPVLFSDDLLFVSWYEAGAVAIDIRNPSAPILVGRFDISLLPNPEDHGGIFGVYPLLGLDRVLLSDVHKGFFIVDATCATLLQPQDKDQQSCINELNRNFAKVAKAQAKDITSCIKKGSQGKLLQSMTIEECTTSDLKGKVAKAKSKTNEKAAQRCGTPPDFGAMNAATVNEAAVQKELDLVHAVFGSDLDATIIKRSDPSRPNAKAESKCQVDVVKSMRKCQDARLKEFNKCTKALLRSDTCVFGLTACIGEDPRGRIAGACDPVDGKVETTIQRKCVSLGVTDLSAAFAGCGTDDAAQLAACLDALAKCRVCLALNQANALDSDCDEFDDGVVNGSCP